MQRFHTSRRAQLVAISLGAALVGLSPSASASSAAAVADPDISVASVQRHLGEFQRIATANGGNRAAGTSGYQASVDFVKARLDAAGYATTVQSFRSSAGTSYNVIATLAGTDPSSVVMAGAHLDSVRSGAGINDNASGSAAVLETALAYAASGQKPRNTLKFGFWGAEELGLVGSKAYVASLSQAERSRIKLYMNFDMIGSVNPGYFVYNDNRAGNAVRDEITAWYDAKGVAWEYVDVQGRSDHAAFRAAGLPTAGIFSGAEDIKTASQAAKWGGTAGRAFDPCYHRSCDTTSNISATALDRGSDLIGAMVFRYAAKNYGTTPGPDPDPGTGNLLQNPGFESGASVGWTGTGGAVTNSSARPARTGSWKMWLGGEGRSTSENGQQTVTIPASATRATLSAWVRIDSAETTTSRVYDTLSVQVVSGGSTKTLATYSNLDKSGSYTQRSFDLSAYRGQSVTVRFASREDSYLQTSFVVDDTALSVS